MTGLAACIRAWGFLAKGGAGMVLAGIARDERGRPRLALDDEPRALALLATAYERPVEACVVAKLRRAGERWTEGGKALAYIHLAHASVPPCGMNQALRLFVADELIEAGVTSAALMKAQGFDPASLGLLKFNPKQPAPEEKPPEPEVAKPKTEPVHPPAAEHGISSRKELMPEARPAPAGAIVHALWNDTNYRGRPLTSATRRSNSSGVAKPSAGPALTLI
jgi:hypothetical protein